MEYRYFSSYRKNIEINNNSYPIYIYEDYNSYELEVNLKSFRGFREFPTDEVIEKFISEFFELVQC